MIQGGCGYSIGTLKPVGQPRASSSDKFGKNSDILPCIRAVVGGSGAYVHHAIWGIVSIEASAKECSQATTLDAPTPHSA